jgi:hypothetical protein
MVVVQESQDVPFDGPPPILRGITYQISEGVDRTAGDLLVVADRHMGESRIGVLPCRPREIYQITPPSSRPFLLDDNTGEILAPV